MNILYRNTFQRIFGTYPLKDEVLNSAVSAALSVGYRAFDTAQMYGNERDLGNALARTAVKRDELCIITKVQPKNFDEQKFMSSVEESLNDLRLEFVDVLLLHWPPSDGAIVPPLKMLETCHRSGLARNIGVSNFNARMMREAKSAISTPLIVNQIEFHPLLNQDKLMQASCETGIPLSAYCSVARGEVFKQKLFDELAYDYGVVPSQIVLRWILQKGVTVNTMSTKPENMKTNFDIMNFNLSNVDMKRIDELTLTNFRVVSSKASVFSPDWN